jgi:hypothetical protein
LRFRDWQGGLANRRQLGPNRVTEESRDGGPTISTGFYVQSTKRKTKVNSPCPRKLGPSILFKQAADPINWFKLDAKIGSEGPGKWVMAEIGWLPISRAQGSSAPDRNGAHGQSTSATDARAPGRVSGPRTPKSNSSLGLDHVSCCALGDESTSSAADCVLCNFR